MKGSAWWMLTFLGLMAAACKGSAPDGRRRTDFSPVLGRVGAEVLSTEDLRALIRRQPDAAAIFASEDRKRALLDSEIRLMVMADRTAKLGLDQDPEVVRARRQQAAALLVRREIEEKEGVFSPSDQEVERYFDSHAGEFIRPEEVHVAEVSAKDRPTAVAAAQARSSDAAADEAAFKEIVNKFSDDAQGRLRGGDLGFLVTGDPTHDPNIVKAAFALSRRGDVSGPIRAGGRYHVLRLLLPARRRPPFVEGSERADSAETDPGRTTAPLDDLVEKARKEASIEIFPGRLADLKD